MWVLDVGSGSGDLVYCRFVLHHLYSPRQAIRLFYQVLNKGGIYIGEEGIVSAAFSYPSSYAWQFERGNIAVPDEEEGSARDGDFGMKLYYWMKKVEFNIKDIKLIQPILYTAEQKTKLIAGHDAYKKTALAQGKTEAEWEEERKELQAIAADDLTLIGFYPILSVLWG